MFMCTSVHDNSIQITELRKRTVWTYSYYLSSFIVRTTVQCTSETFFLNGLGIFLYIIMNYFYHEIFIYMIILTIMTLD